MSCCLQELYEEVVVPELVEAQAEPDPLTLPTLTFPDFGSLPGVSRIW
jgi:hypothetical protein